MWVCDEPHGAAGIAAARACRPDVITLDVPMPNMDGWSVLGRPKNDHELSGVPVVMVTFVAHRPRFIILDLMMPEVDGFEFLSLLYAESPEEWPTILVMTARELTAADMQRLNGKVSRVLQKARLPGQRLAREIARFLPAGRLAARAGH